MIQNKKSQLIHPEHIKQAFLYCAVPSIEDVLDFTRRAICAMFDVCKSGEITPTAARDIIVSPD